VGSLGARGKHHIRLLAVSDSYVEARRAWLYAKWRRIDEVHAE